MDFIDEMECVLVGVGLLAVQHPAITCFQVEKRCRRHLELQHPVEFYEQITFLSSLPLTLAY